VDGSDPFYKKHVTVSGESHQRQLVDGSDPFYRKHVTVSGESHQRQLVDGSDPFYRELPSQRCARSAPEEKKVCK